MCQSPVDGLGKTHIVVIFGKIDLGECDFDLIYVVFGTIILNKYIYRYAIGRIINGTQTPIEKLRAFIVDYDNIQQFKPFTTNCNNFPKCSRIPAFQIIKLFFYHLYNRLVKRWINNSLLSKLHIYLSSTFLVA